MSSKPSNNQKVIEQLISTINDAKLPQKDIIKVTSNFLYSLGFSLERCTVSLSSEGVLKRYASNPTFGNALMAQAIYMKEAWTEEEE